MISMFSSYRIAAQSRKDSLEWKTFFVFPFLVLANDRETNVLYGHFSCLNRVFVTEQSFL